MIGYKKAQKSNRGLTFIEFLVAMSLFIVVITVTLSLFSMSIKAYRRIIVMQNIQENARFLMEFMTKEIRMSKINSSTVSALSITRSDGQNVTYSFSNGKLERTSPSFSGQINSEEVLITGRFYSEGTGATDGRQPKVTISIKAEGTGKLAEEKAKIEIQTTLSQRADIDLE